MLIQWLVFVPLILPISVVIGALEGVKMTFQRAATDVVEDVESYA